MRIKSINSYFQESGESVRFWAILLFLTCCAWALRVGCHLLEPTLSRDGVYYLQCIQHWYDTGTFPAPVDGRESLILPLALYLPTLVMHFGISGETAAIAVNIVIGGLMVPVIYGITVCLFQDRRLALCAALLLTIHPGAVGLAIEIQRDTLYLFFSGLVILGGAAAFRFDRQCWWILAGVFEGCNLLTRYEALEFFPILFIYLGMAVYFRRISWKRASSAAALFLCVTLAVCLLLSVLTGTWQYICEVFLMKTQTLMPMALHVI